VSCPDWTRLAAHRLEAAGAEGAAEPAGWAAALDHLDECPRCRADALEADPLLLFRRLPRVESDAEDVRLVRSGVEALRRVRRLEAEGSGVAESPDGRWWRRAAVAAGLAGMLLSVHPSAHDGGAAMDSAARLGLGSALARTAPEPSPEDVSEWAAVDEIERPTASVYHFDGGDVGVVMVVDAGLDV
jgi:hypothetical protein